MALGGEARKILVEFLGDARELVAASREGEAAVSTFGTKAQTAGKIAGKALAGGLLLAGAGFYEAGKAASENEASQAQLTQQLKNNTQATDEQITSVNEWIEKQAVAKGVAVDDLRPAMAKLATVTGDVTKAQQLLSFAMDVSAGSGKSLDSVTSALQKAQNGSVSGLSRLGLATKDAAGKTMTFNQILAANAKKYQGDAAKAAETTAGKNRVLGVEMHELGVKIGTGVLPVMQKLTEIGLKVADYTTKHTKTVGLAIAAFGAFLTVTWAIGTAMGIYAVVTGEATAATLLQKAAVGAVAVATKTYAAAQWLLNAAMDANPIGLVVIAIAALVAGVILAYKHSETFRDIVNGAFAAVKTGVLTAIHAVTDAVGWMVGFVKDHWQLLLVVVLGPTGILVGQIIKHWDTFKAVTAAVFHAIKDIVVGEIAAVVATIHGVEAIVRFVRGIFGDVRDAVGNAMHDVHDVVARLWGGARDIITNGAQDIVDAVRSIPGRLANLADNFASVGSKIINAFVNGLKGGGGIVSDIAGNVWDALRGMINSAIDHINSALEFPFNTHIPGVGTVTVNPPDIPHLAAGGIVTRPTYALIGEAGPEAVVPLSRSGLANAGLGAQTQVTISLSTLDPRESWRIIEAGLREAERRTSRKLLFSAP